MFFCFCFFFSHFWAITSRLCLMFSKESKKSSLSFCPCSQYNIFLPFLTAQGYTQPCPLLVLWVGHLSTKEFLIPDLQFFSQFCSFLTSSIPDCCLFFSINEGPFPILQFLPLITSISDLPEKGNQNNGSSKMSES